jgi:hypothetical protein
MSTTCICMYVILIEFAAELNHARKTYARAWLHVLMSANILSMVCWANALQESSAKLSTIPDTMQVNRCGLTEVISGLHMTNVQSCNTQHLHRCMHHSFPGRPSEGLSAEARAADDSLNPAPAEPKRKRCRVSRPCDIFCCLRQITIMQGFFVSHHGVSKLNMEYGCSPLRPLPLRVPASAIRGLSYFQYS